MTEKYEVPVRVYVIDPQDPSVSERSLTWSEVYMLCGGPVEVVRFRAATDDSHALELYIGDSGLYHPDHRFTFLGQTYVGTGVIIAMNEAGATVDVDVSLEWVSSRVDFPE